MEELDFIFGNDDRIPTLEDINQMEYLERVIKETMRVLPTVPLVLRTVDKDIKLGMYYKFSDNFNTFFNNRSLYNSCWNPRLSPNWIFRSKT